MPGDRARVACAGMAIDHTALDATAQVHQPSGRARVTRGVAGDQQTYVNRDRTAHEQGGQRQRASQAPCEMTRERQHTPNGQLQHVLTNNNLP